MIWHVSSHFICTVYWVLLPSTGRIPTGKNKYQGGKSINKRKFKRWLQAGGGRAPGGLSRSRQCAGRSCRSSPRTPAAARRSHSPCPPCAGSGVDKRPTLSPCPVRGTRKGQGHRAAAARGQLRRTCTLDTRCCAVPQNGRPNLPMSSCKEAQRLSCAQHGVGQHPVHTLPAATSVSQLRPTVRADVVRWPLVENHCLGRRHDQGQPSGGLGLA